MANRTINDEIIDIISYELKNIHFPSECIITKIYENNYVDIESTIYGSLTYVKACGDYDINEKSILLFLNNELSSPIVIGGSDNDISDLIELITQLKNELMNKVDKVYGKGLSTNDFTDTLKSKLDNIENGANKITVDSLLSSTSTNPLQNKSINTALNNKVDKINGKSLSTNDFTDTLKSKLDAIEEKANKIVVDSALSSTSTNPVQNKVINTSLGNKVDKVSGKGLSTNDFTSTLKTKLDGISEGANKTTVDSALSSTSTNPVQNKIINNAITAINGSNIKLNASSNSSVEEAINGKASSSHTHNNVVTQNIPQNADLNSYTTVGVYRNGSNAQVQTMNNTPWGNKPSGGQAFSMIVLSHAGVTQILRPFHTADYNIFTRNYYNGSWGAWKTIYTTGNVGLASSSADGFMAKADKSKLDGIATGATKVTVDSALSSTSTNPLQNKAINTALNGKAPNSHASTGNTYGLGSTTNYGHVKTINSLTQSSHSDGTALSAYQGKVLNDNITNASRIKLRFGTSNSTTSYSTTPLSISIVKGNNVYVSCVNYAGTAMGGKVILEINGALYERTLSGGVCSLTINLIAGSYTLRAYYHNNGEFITSGVCKITVT